MSSNWIGFNVVDNTPTNNRAELLIEYSLTFLESDLVKQVYKTFQKCFKDSYLSIHFGKEWNLLSFCVHYDGWVKLFIELYQFIYSQNKIN